MIKLSSTYLKSCCSVQHTCFISCHFIKKNYCWLINTIHTHFLSRCMKVDLKITLKLSVIHCQWLWLEGPYETNPWITFYGYTLSKTLQHCLCLSAWHTTAYCKPCIGHWVGFLTFWIKYLHMTTLNIINIIIFM